MPHERAELTAVDAGEGRVETGLPRGLTHDAGSDGGLVLGLSEDIELIVEGEDGFVLRGASTMREISRDPLQLVAQTIGANHQYPDGFMLFLGTLFAPVQDRDVPGRGFTHSVGDRVTIRSPHLGALANRVNTCDRITPWTFGLRALFSNLAARGLLKTPL